MDWEFRVRRFKLSHLEGMDNKVFLKPQGTTSSLLG